MHLHVFVIPKVEIYTFIFKICCGGRFTKNNLDPRRRGAIVFFSNFSARGGDDRARARCHGGCRGSTRRRAAFIIAVNLDRHGM
jgi:hypothetical protein